MKKLMIAAAIVCAAALTHAATCNWGSGAMMGAKDATGGWDTSRGAVANNILCTFNVYYLTDDVDLTTGQTAAQKYASLAGKSQAEILKYIDDNELSAKLTGQNKNATSGATVAAATLQDTTASASTTYYAILTAEYTDTKFGDMYMATTATATVSPTGTGTASNIFGGTTGVKDWQAVPEPTSGLLLLLGVAGLALRRRRA